MKRLAIDIETYSATDLKECGVHKYVEDDDFTILLFAYKEDDKPTMCVDFASGEVLPTYIYDALWDYNVEKTAFNAAFERACIGRYFNRYCDPQQWDCTMVLSAVCGLPLSLKAVGEALGLGEDKAKMKEGADLIKYFCVPCKPTKTNGGRTRNLPSDAPEKWETFKAYNIRDVDVENTIRESLIKWRPDYSEHKLWSIDQGINDRGMRVDITLANNAITMGDTYRQKLIDRAIEISGLDNPNSNTQIKQWLEDQEGIEVLSLNKKTIIDVVANLKDESTKEFMALRTEFSKSSIKKYEAVQRCVCKDEHARGCFQFAGAGRTGRWAGRLIQFQNLPQNHLEDLDSARELVRDGDYETFSCLYPNIQSTLSELIRTVLIPEEGHKFIVCDFSAIEARVLSWVAGETWRLDTFKDGKDIYCASASQAFKVPVEKHGVNSHLRQKGKVMELACVAQDQLVITDVGLVPIQNVNTSMKVWDGENWVSHDGLIHKGYRNTIYLDGIEVTPEHKIFTTKGMVESVKADGLIWADIRFPYSYRQSPRLHKSKWFKKNNVELPMGYKECKRAQQKEQPQNNIIRSRNDNSGSRRKGGYKIHNLVGKSKKGWTISIRDGKANVPVYDILNAGANHRFCLYDPNTNKIRCVSNCGYGGGVGALKAFGADKLGMTEEEMADTVDKWRAASPHIVALWHSVEKAAIKCVAKKTATLSTVGNILFSYEDGVMWITLPSKRRIAYWGAEIGEDKWGRKSLTYMGTDQKTKKWTRLETFGGKIVENIIQATARDCLKEVMIRLDANGYDIRGHVHDEVIITEPINGRTVEDVSALMGEEIEWAIGLPLRGDGYECSSYRKD